MDVCREKKDVKREEKSMDLLTFDNHMRVFDFCVGTYFIHSIFGIKLRFGSIRFDIYDKLMEIY